ncbi:MAG TPA: Wzt carbohydrate-binding domain-containing protein, partial [Pyrinomonadaceae bacterium]
ERGQATEQGEINQVVDSYLKDGAESAHDSLVETNSFVIENVEVLSTTSPVIKTFEPCEMRVKFRSKIDIGDPGLYLGILTNELQRLSGLDFKDFASLARVKAGETVEIGFRIESLPLLPGTYQLEIHLKDMATHLIEFVPRHYQFDVVETPVYGSRRLDRWFGTTALSATPLMPERTEQAQR